VVVSIAALTLIITTIFLDQPPISTSLMDDGAAQLAAGGANCSVPHRSPIGPHLTAEIARVFRSSISRTFP